MARVAAHHVDLHSYRASVAPGLLDRVGGLVRERAPAHRFALITDDAVGPRYASRVAASFGSAHRPHVVTIPCGETEKTRETWGRLTDALVAEGFGRDSAIVALGGGVVGDLAGFVAATFMRGIPYVHVPTTLLAMIDASIGGKTGVDTPAGKNLVGALHQPVAVLIDPEALATLPMPHLRAGLAEALKHGVVADESYFTQVVNDAPLVLGAHGERWFDAVTSLVVRSVEIKADVVNRDVGEEGLRKTLNFGHTLGHAIEFCSGYRMLHGEAVAAGMVLESDLAERAGIAERGTVGRVRDAVGAVGLPTRRPPDQDPSRVLEATRADKKARRGVVEYALPRRVGAMAGETDGWACAVSDDLVLEVLA